MSQLDTPIYDKAQALARLDNDESLFTELMELFVAESESYCQALEAALSSGDAANLRREAHTVKSLLATFSYETGRELAMRLEHLAAGGTLDGAESLTHEVIAAVQRLSAVFVAEAA